MCTADLTAGDIHHGSDLGNQHEMKEIIADSGIEEILMLTGESRAQSDVEYIGEACRLAKKYFRNIGLEIYPVNSDEYRYLHECGADYVTVFRETYGNVKYETLHLMGHKRAFIPITGRTGACADGRHAWCRIFRIAWTF